MGNALASFSAPEGGVNALSAFGDPIHSPLRPFNPGERVENADGSYSTERTVTVQGPDGRWIVVPSLWMGPNGPVDLSRFGDDYIERIARGFATEHGQAFPSFGASSDADAWAVQRSAGGGASQNSLARGVR